MILAGIKIHRTERGLIVEQVAFTDQESAHPEERIVAGILDVALKEVMEFVGKNSGTATMIEGKDIEAHINRFLKEHHTQSFQTQMKRVGVKLPPQP